MRWSFYVLLFIPLFLEAQSTDVAKTIHVYVALCDNLNQGIVPVPKSLGDGKNPNTNLYWGALYGVKTHFDKSKEWELLKTLETPNSIVLERLLFRHKESHTYLLADAYDGKYIKQTTIDFLRATSGDMIEKVKYDTKELFFGGGSGLLAYVGHDGLMEFDLEVKLEPCNTVKRDAIILACISKNYFKPYLEQTGANALVWSTGLMSPEAYTLKWAIEGWIKEEDNTKIRERAAQAYHKYQKCGIRGARKLLVTGF